jgi:hypothetical protein
MAKIEKTVWSAREDYGGRSVTIVGEYHLAGGGRLVVKRAVNLNEVWDSRDPARFLQAIGEDQKARLDKAASEVTW